jgi:hypothetical protein
MKERLGWRQTLGGRCAMLLPHRPPLNWNAQFSSMPHGPLKENANIMTSTPRQAKRTGEVQRKTKCTGDNCMPSTTVEVSREQMGLARQRAVRPPEPLAMDAKRSYVSDDSRAPPNMLWESDHPSWAEEALLSPLRQPFFFSITTHSPCPSPSPSPHALFSSTRFTPHQACSP